MKTSFVLLLFLSCITTTIFSQTIPVVKTSGQSTTSSQDLQVKPGPPPRHGVNRDIAMQRNMFGIGIPRGLKVNTTEASEGYVLFAVPNSPLVYLLNRKGEVVHQWKSNYAAMAAVVYLANDGSIYQNTVDPDFPVFAGGGEAGRIQKISWDSRVLWDFEYANEKEHHHHDFAVMPNGNILAIAWEAKTVDEVASAGRKPNMIPKAGLWPDKIVEIKPDGEHGGKIIWEWHMWDHMVQDYDAKKKNYGKPAMQPELLDINVGDTVPPLISRDSMNILIQQGRRWKNNTPENIGSDVYHVNAVDYNAELDQIVFSSPDLSEIFIIDHSTTSQEAAGHKGGRYGKGGDFLYRWGNPQNYHQGDSTAQKLFHQHDVRWIEKGYPGEGNLTIFNNDIHRWKVKNYSAIYELTLPREKNGNYAMDQGKTFGPAKPTWAYVAPDSVSFWSSFISGAHRLKNGNTFIAEGAKGRFLEVTKDGKIVWEYLNPYRGDGRKPNGDPRPAFPLVYITFRSTFIRADHPGLTNKKLQAVAPQPTAYVMPPGSPGGPPAPK
jgi:hypothetical protein